jgi:hypothetical protein
VSRIERTLHVATGYAACVLQNRGSCMVTSMVTAVRLDFFNRLLPFGLKGHISLLGV